MTNNPNFDAFMSFILEDFYAPEYDSDSSDESIVEIDSFLSVDVYNRDKGKSHEARVREFEQSLSVSAAHHGSF